MRHGRLDQRRIGADELAGGEAQDGVHEVVVLLGQARDLVRPEVLGTEGMVRVALHEEVLEEAHVLEAEEGDLMLGLVDYDRRGGILAFEACLYAVAAGGAGFLTLDPSPFAIETTAAALGMTSTFQPCPLGVCTA